jgi:hypothetical protein
MGEAIQIVRYVAVAAYAIHVYEWLICFSDEYLYIHKARWTSVKAAYLICRYFPLFVWPVYLWAWVGDHTASVCAIVVKPLFPMLAFFPAFAQAVFVIRTYAFTGRSKFILAFLVACWSAILGTILWVYTTKFSLIDDWINLVGPSGCFAANKTASTHVAFSHTTLEANAVYLICSFVFELLMTAIVFFHCIRYRSMRGRLGKSFVVHGLMAFVILSATNLATAIAFLSPDPKWDSMNIMNSLLSDLIACRLILMLRRQVNPSATIQDRKRSRLVRDAIGRLEVMENVAIEASRQNQVIEGWD